ncbi:MAG: type II toxin-antitoxin system RelE/ParE family toxin [Acidimicrobiales bacterium]
MSYAVHFHEDAVVELLGLGVRDQEAIGRAQEKLQALGERLPFPHQSALQGGTPLRELRPRGGRCRWRALYARVDDGFVILAVVPEALVDRRGFDRGVVTARRRLEEIEEGS